MKKRGFKLRQTLSLLCTSNNKYSAQILAFAGKSSVACGSKVDGYGGILTLITNFSNTPPICVVDIVGKGPNGSRLAFHFDVFTIKDDCGDCVQIIDSPSYESSINNGLAGIHVCLNSHYPLLFLLAKVFFSVEEEIQ